MEEDHPLTMRALSPETEVELFREAYSWRTPKRHLQPDRMAFEDFSANDPSQIVWGLFNGKLCAVFVFKEFEKGRFESHFTSRRDVPKNYILAAAGRLVDWFMENGAELTADVIKRNTPMRRFVESIGFHPTGIFVFPPDNREFVHYSAQPKT